MTRKKRIYMDNASTTLIDENVLKEIVYHLKNTIGNAGSIHEEGVLAKKVLYQSRKIISESINCRPEEIIFTSGGTESNNIAILGVIAHLKNSTNLPYSKMRIVVSEIEHSSVLEVAKNLEKMGVIVDYLPVSEQGLIDLDYFKKVLKPETVLISVQYANNEIGTVEPIREMAKIVRNFKKQKFHNTNKEPKNSFPLFHVDASQAFAYQNSNVEWLGVDLLTMDGQKIYGPKGVGALYIKKGTPIESITFGGNQEAGIRPGTPNVPMIAGLSKAVSICTKQREKESERIKKLRDYILEEISKINRGKFVINGDLDYRLPNNINLSLLEKDSEFLTLQLDVVGIAVSTKSACFESEGASHVISALYKNKNIYKNTLRISLGRYTKMGDCKKLLIYLKKYL